LPQHFVPGKLTVCYSSRQGRKPPEAIRLNKAIEQMLAPSHCQTRDDHISALREILQQIALLGLWRKIQTE
jgi:hypothetical protein